MSSTVDRQRATEDSSSLAKFISELLGNEISLQNHEILPRIFKGLALDSFLIGLVQYSIT